MLRGPSRISPDMDLVVSSPRIGLQWVLERVERASGRLFGRLVSFRRKATWP